MTDETVAALADALWTPIYTIQGVDAVVTLRDGVTSFAIKALDKTRGARINFKATHRTNVYPLEVDTVKPVARLRMKELIAAGYRIADIDKGSITLNNATWKIKSTVPSPGPFGGELVGEAVLILADEPESTA